MKFIFLVGEGQKRRVRELTVETLKKKPKSFLSFSHLKQLLHKTNILISGSLDVDLGWDVNT